MANWPLPTAGTNHENLIPPHPPLEKGGIGGFESYFLRKTEC
jgi:hypothetical protein